MPTAIIIGIGSDIGRELAVRFAADGWIVKGTYRGAEPPGGIPCEAKLVRCDLASHDSVAAALEWIQLHCVEWDAVIVAAGTMEPIGEFWSTDPDEWERGIQANALGPLRLVRGLYPLRRKDSQPAVVFFSGAGTNNAAPSYSAYAAAKILLIKMCELLDAESPDTSFFIVGPGLVRTKIHQQTLDADARSGANLGKVKSFLGSADPGVSHDDIYACLRWGMQAGKHSMGGRNLSLVHDAWREGGSGLLRWLGSDGNRYKLRRYGNDQNTG